MLVAHTLVVDDGSASFKKTARREGSLWLEAPTPPTWRCSWNAREGAEEKEGANDASDCAYFRAAERRAPGVGRTGLFKDFPPARLFSARAWALSQPPRLRDTLHRCARVTLHPSGLEFRAVDDGVRETTVLFAADSV